MHRSIIGYSFVWREIGAMTTNKRGRACTIRQVAGILGLSPGRAARAVRLGIIRSEMQRGRLIVREREIARLLDGGDDLVSSRVADETVEQLTAALARYRDVPTDVLESIVNETCSSPLLDDTPPDSWSDEEVARQVCSRCDAPYACVELQFRLDGAATPGVWGGLSEDERRELFAAWADDRPMNAGGESV